MKSISLLPSKYKKMKSSGRRREFLVAALGILSLAAIFASVIIKIFSTIPGEKLKMLKAENEHLLQSIQALDYLNELEENIRKEADLAQKAVENQPDWLTLYASISAAVPDGLHLSSITAETEETKLFLIIQGNTRSNALLSEWLDRLKELEELSGNGLNYARAVDESASMIEFEVKTEVESSRPFKLFEEAMK